MIRGTPSVIVPLAPGVSPGNLIELAGVIAGRKKGRVLVLSVVEVPEERSLSEGVSTARRRRELLRKLGDELDPSRFEFAVRAARSIAEGVRDAVSEYDASHLVMGWRGPLRSETRLRRSPLESLILNPPCDLAILRPGRVRLVGGQSTETATAPVWPPRSILVPVRGGPHADLALSLAKRISDRFGARLTVLRIRRSIDIDMDDLTSEPLPTSAQVISLTSETVGDTIAEYARDSDFVILGASARGSRSTRLFGRVPEELTDALPGNVMIVKTSKLLIPEMFGVLEPALHSATELATTSISTVVDQWFAENTFHSHEFEDLDELVRLKQRQNVSISIALPALNEEATIGKIIGTIKQRTMVDVPLVDELIVIDSDSQDRTCEIAQEMEVPVFSHSQILPEMGSNIGKGEGLWKSLHVTTGDIVVWIDSDITDIHPRFVYGLLGPLLTQPRIDFVKGYYRRPLNLGGEMLTTGGGRVTELTARPMLNLLYPLLSGLVQPLAGEMAGRRSLLEQLPFFTGYGVETGLLIDILEGHGLQVIAQTDLENRIHRNQDMISLSKMAFAIIQVVMRRLAGQRQVDLIEEINTTMKLIHYSPEELFLEVKEIHEGERPPMITIDSYRNRGAKPV